jgi:hypothetical protein
MTLSTVRNIMTLEEVADYLRVPADVVLAQVQLGQLPGRKLVGISRNTRLNRRKPGIC